MSETTPRVSTAPGAVGAAPHDGNAYVFEEEPSPTSVSARAGLLEILRRELLGPAEGDSEVLTTQPSQHYLLGRIAPTRLQNTAETPAAETSEDREGIDPLDAAASTGVPVTGSEEDTLSATVDEDPGEDTDDEPVRRGLMIPASMGLRFQVPADLDALNVHVSWGTYEPTGAGAETGQASADTGTRYRRVPHTHSLRLEPTVLTPGRTEDRILDGDVTLRIDSHLDEPAGRYLIELALCNDRTTPRRIPTEAWMFQTRIDVDAGGRAVFLPVHDPTLPPPPGSGPRPEPGSEEARLDLQYRDRLEFAVGRTCSADWSLLPTPAGDEVPRRAVQVRTTWMPTVETPQTAAADVPGALLDMRALAAAAAAPNGSASLRDALDPIVSAYSTWLDEQAKAAADMPDHLRGTAEEALAEAHQVRSQLAEGLDHLTADTPDGAEARRCFAFMNRVMADQRVHSQIAAARAVDSSLSVEEAEARVLARDYPHHWRVFQLAFILMQLPALADPAAERRSGALATVELLFFPTGGGKTEAYLGLAAYAFAIRRRQGLLETPYGPIDGRAGVTVLMRYTLRLLTSQQFQRATTLVCAAELARREDPATWGSEPFRIGLWVGTAVSPKRVKEADDELRRLRERRGGGGAGYRFSALQLGHCPWCGLALSPNDVVVGAVGASVDRVIVRCPDKFGECPFSEGDSNVPDGLPVLTTDEEIYRLAPAFVIATVDKLARLAREGHAATLFGHVARRCGRHGYVPGLDHRNSSDYAGCTLADNGHHHAKGSLPAATVRPVTRLRPPDLIIQDELHLITGALGTTVGLFETAVDTMCAWTAPDGRPAAPLLVASSATVRKVSDQVRFLYGRDVTIFPPQVLDASDTFFSRAVPIDAAHPGRLYVGLSTTGVRLTAAEIQTTQVLMAGAQLLLDRVGAPTDPYMTLVGYFSATRELAGMARYVQDDIQTGLAKPGRGSRLPRRRGTDFGALRLGELTSRVSSADITATLDRMGLTFDPDVDSTAAKDAAVAATRAGKSVQRRDAAAKPYDVVLATSMLQVGVDVPRLGLMLVVGQPKNTAEYIQATSRVGRDANRPGLVVTLGNWARPRDLAHYEQFRHFHETFYARVEPLSVTPFSVTAVDRGLDGALVAAARVTQAGTREGLNPEHDAGNASAQREALTKLASALTDRVTAAGGEDAARYTASRLEARLSEWRRREKDAAGRGGELVYERGADDARFFALLRSAESAGGHTPQRDEAPFVVAGSMREVQPEINLLVSPDPSRLVDRAPEDGPAWQRQEPADTDGTEQEEKQ